MESNRLERNEDATVVSSPERILCDGRQIAAVSITATPVGNPPIAAQSMEAGVEQMADQIPRAESEDTFHGFIGRPVSKSRPALTP